MKLIFYLLIVLPCLSQERIVGAGQLEEVSTASTTLAVPASEYEGNIGDSECYLALYWHADTSVTGNLSQVALPYEGLTLEGENYAEGKLRLNVKYGAETVAQVLLRKENTATQIQWVGVMTTLSNGNAAPISFAKKRNVPQPTQVAFVPIKRYYGNVGKLSTQYAIQWHKDGRVTGTYTYPTRAPKIVYRLVGHNHVDGQLYFKEYTGNTVSAEVKLTKQNRDGKVIWRGTMYNTDGRQLSMTMQR